MSDNIMRSGPCRHFPCSDGRFKRISILILIQLQFLLTSCQTIGEPIESADSASSAEMAAAAQNYGKARPFVTVQPDGLIICEAEEFQVQSPGWKARPWGENYYAATLANTFLSRQAFLGAPERGEKSKATIQVQIPEMGRYLALVRYEAAFRFETQFHVVIKQDGKTLLNRLYGARDNVKIWPFSKKLKKEVGWEWGAVENVVWEGHDTFVDLKPGLASITLIADQQPEPAAKRNVDLVMLTADVEQVKMRIDKEMYLPLDGMLTQSGDVWLRVTNLGGAPLTFTGILGTTSKNRGNAAGNWQQHSPYWVHLRNWEVPKFDIQPDATSEWVEVGSTMDSLFHGQWSWTGNGQYKAEFALKNPAGEMDIINTFTGTGDLMLAADGNTRYSRRLRTQDEILFEMMAFLKKQPVHGKAPTLTSIHVDTFKPSADPKHAAAVSEFRQMYGFDHADGSVVSLGDEIALPSPGGATTDTDFRDWLESRGMTPADIDPAAGNDWSKITYNPAGHLKNTKAALFYWSNRYRHHFGIQGIKKRTEDILDGNPNAKVGANFSPHYPNHHMYLGEVYKWVNVFRDGGMNMPWSEDYIWQVALGTQQMNGINLDLFRAGLRGKPHLKIMYYVMAHSPGNTPRSWRRQFYTALGHGMKLVNLFEFQPVYVAYTENHSSDPEMYATLLRTFRELGLYEDITQAGHNMPAEAGLWFSETSDIWGDTYGSFAAAKRAFYIAIRHQQIPLDFVTERDAIDGTLSEYKVLYLADAHVSGPASAKIAAWVDAGGYLMATAGAGMFDELNRPNKVMRQLLGVDQTVLDAPGSQVTYIKQDLPFADPIDTVTIDIGFLDGEKRDDKLPVIGVRSRIRVSNGMVNGRFADGSPAIVTKQTGKGQSLYCAFLTGLSYFKPAIPLRPVDRSSNDAGMNHFLPMQFDSNAAAIIGLPAAAITRPVVCSNPLVDTTVIESKHGIVIPLINWTPNPIKGLRVAVAIETRIADVTLASGAELKTTVEDGRRTYTFDIDTADVLILR